MAQLILIGNTTATAALAVAEAGGTPVTVYFDDQDTSNGQSNNTAGVLEVGDILYTTYTPADPNTGTPESYTNPYDPTGGSAVWHFATDPSSNQLTVRVEGDAANTLGEVLNINTHSYDTLTSDVANVDEGGSVEFTVTTTNIPDGTTVLYSISGTGIDVNDFNPALNSLTGNITINSDTGSVTFILNEDVTTESAETLTLQLASADSNGVNTGALTHGVTINDTSLTVVNLPPLLDTPTAATASVTQNGQGNDSVTIDLSQHTQDPEQDPNGMTWKILTAPLTGSVRDTGGPTAGNNIPSFPHTLSGSNVIYRPDNTGAPSTTTFTWTAEDGSNTYPNGGQTADATATITINTPANTAPTGNAISLDLVANNSQNSTQFQRLATDDNTNSANLTFEWCLSQQQGGTTQNLAQINAALNHGQIAANSNVQGFTYTQNSGVNVNPGGNALEDIFYYKATDDDTTPLTSDPIQVQINNIGPVNNPPSWNPSNPGNTISIVAGTPYTVSAAATDQDGHTLIYTVTASNPSAINGTYNEVSQELTVTAQQAAGGSITIQATEDYPGGVSSSTTFQFSASATAERPLKFSTFSNSDTAVCNLTRSGNLSIPSGTKFYSTGQNGTDFIEDIAVGDFIYDDDDLQPTSVTKPTTNGYEWMSIEGFDSSGNLQVKAVKLNLTTGAIEQVLNCSVQSGAAWPIIVEYAENSNNFCAGQRPPIIDGEAWQNIADGATLTDVVANNGQLFSSEYYANQYTNNDSPTNYILASGIYRQPIDPVTAANNYYQSDYDGSWIGVDINDPDYDAAHPNRFVCTPPINYVTKQLQVYYYSADPTNISAVCDAIGPQWDATAQANFEQVTIYFRWDSALPNQMPNLLTVAKDSPLIFVSENAADSQNYSSLFTSSILVDEFNGGFVLWDNNDFSGFSGSYGWYGFDGNNVLEIMQNTSVLGGCGDGVGGPQADYQRTGLWGIRNDILNDEGAIEVSQSIQIGAESSSRRSIYYAFYACDAQLDPGVPGGQPYFPIYVVDGMADYTEYTQTGVSYISDFILSMSTNLDVRSQIRLAAGECLTYTNYIVATNIEDAVNQMQIAVDSIGGDLNALAISINAVDLGLGSQAQLTWRNITSPDDEALICYSCETQSPGVNHDWANYTFPAIENADVLDRTQPNFDLEVNYTLDNISKPLLRTNPKLSTNAKIVANSSDEIFLESIDATKELASVEYKRWALNPRGDYSQDLYKFYKNSFTPADLMYATRKDYSDFTVQDSFDKQIEEVYHYGTAYNYSKLHAEDFRILAPIWLDKDVPKRFVVFRVNDPVGEMDFDTRGNFDNIQDILKNSEIVKTFDLTSDSALGQYIRGHVNAESFPKSPIQFNFERREKSSFNGIDLGKGGFTSKGEYLYQDFVRMDSPLIAANAMITDGFERNKLACANLLNLEFLFDDDNVSDYTINRYFGLYVNDIDSGYGNVSSADSGNIIFKNLNSYINESQESAIPSFKQISTTPTLGYVNVSEEFYKISPRTTYDESALNIRVEDDNNKIASEIKIAPNGNSIDIVREDSPGFDFVKFKVTGTPAVNDRFTIFESRESSYEIKILRLIPNESWTLKINDGGTIVTTNVVIPNSVGALANNIAGNLNTYTNISVTSNCGPGEPCDKIFINEINASLGDLQVEFNPTVPVSSSTIAKVTQLQSSDTLFTFFADNTLSPGLFSGNKFSSQGTSIDIAVAISGCVNSSPINFDAIIEEGADEFYIKNRVSGYRLLQSGITIPNLNSIEFLELTNRDVRTLNNLDGLLRLSTVVTDNNEVYYMNGGNSSGKSVLVTQDSVSDISIGDMLSTSNEGVFNQVIDIVDDIKTPNTVYKKLILDKKNSIESGEQKVYAENVARIGLFSAYDIHDMNFDFYDIENSELKELELETAQKINYEPERSSQNTLSVFGNDYEIGDVYSYFTGISDVLPEETEDEYNENKLFSEYDRLQENNLKEFATRSRIVPNINKWVLKDSLTVREQPYYLNANEAFGQTNFSPNFESVDRDRLGMTHEWFYMDNLPAYVENTDLNNTFSYVNFVNDFKIKPEYFKSTEFNYFDRFMVTEGFETKDEYGIKTFTKTNLQKKYTLIGGGNTASFASTIFKGIRVDFKNRKEFLNAKAKEFVKTSDFNGYKFSTLLLVRGANDTNGIDYEIIQNKKFKFVIFLITVSLDDLWIDGALNRKLLYEMNHSFVWNTELENFAYSDVQLQGAMNLNDINFTNPNAVDYRVVRGISHSNGTEPRFLDQINSDEDNEFGKIQVTITDSTGPVTIELEIRSVDDQDQITLSGNATDLNGNPVNISNIAGYIQNDAEYVYKQGGKNAFTSILDQLSVRNVSDLLDLNDGTIKYTTIDEDGTTLNNRFELQFENGVEIIKDASLLTVPDEDKPRSFRLRKGLIGFNLFSADTYYPFLVRHNGNYTVDTKPVVTFTDMYTHFKTNTLQTSLNQTEINREESAYKHSLTNAEEIKLARDYYKRYNRCGTAFNLGFILDNGTHDSVWGIIKNHFYRKVNESNAAAVTKLSSSTDKLPLYPLIGEVAIDKKDVNVFKSSWDKNYYTRSLSGGVNEAVPGTFETKEERSYLGSTIMKVKDSYEMIEFTSKQVFSQEAQDLILANDNNTTDVVVFEDKNKVYIDFYITTTVKKLLSQDGVLDSLNKFVAPVDSAGDKTTTKDDALLYVENNLLNAFNLDMIKIYTNRIKGKYSEILSTASIANLDDGGYMNDTNFTFKSHEQKPLNFRLIYNKRLGYSYRIRPMIKIKS
mgnify:FL=1